MICVYVYDSKFFIFKLATNNFQSTKIGQVTNFRGLKSDWSAKLEA
jgi:hypothetical protein